MSEAATLGTPTPRLGLTKPTVGDDVDIWGDQTNANWDILDQALLTSGGTLTGSLTVSTTVTINAPAGHYAQLVLSRSAGEGAQVLGETGGAIRWAVAPGDATPETGGNAGSNFAIARYDDAGHFLDSPLFITRATGAATFADSLAVLGPATFYNTVACGGAGVGQAVLTPGSASNPGYLEFRNPAGVRVGYVGWQGSANYLALETEGAYVGYSVSGNLIVGGSANVTGAVTAQGNVGAQQLFAANGIFPYSSDTSFALERSGTTRLLNWASGYYLGWAESGGAWSWVNNNTGIMSLDGAGNLWVAGSLSVPGNANISLSATVNGVTYFGTSGSFYANPNSSGNQVISFASNQYIAFEPGYGFVWQSTGAIQIAGNPTFPNGLTAASATISGGGVFTSGGIGVSGSTPGTTSGYQLAPGGPSPFSGGMNIAVNASGLDVLAGRLIAACDARAKPVRRKISAAEGIRYAMTVPGYLYQKEDRRGDRNWEAGFLAQDVLAAGFPELVMVTDDPDMPALRYGAAGPAGLRYEMVVGGQVAYLAAALRAALDMIGELTTRVAALEGRPVPP